jgi:heme oxygenase
VAAPLSTGPALQHTPFSRTLREATRHVHERAHHSDYMTALLDGRLDLADYAKLAAQYYVIYRALEQASDVMAGDAVGGAFVIDELRRLPALERDLRFLLGEGWAEQLEPVEATMTYAERIHRVATDWPGGYVAHHYVRYLGDLAGGQVVRALLRRTYGIDGPGALFYRFEDIPSVPAFRGEYRARLDAAGWDTGERARIIDEALMAFELNIAVLGDLADVAVRRD